MPDIIFYYGCTFGLGCGSGSDPEMKMDPDPTPKFPDSDSAPQHTCGENEEDGADGEGDDNLLHDLARLRPLPSIRLFMILLFSM